MKADCAGHQDPGEARGDNGLTDSGRNLESARGAGEITNMS